MSNTFENKLKNREYRAMKLEANQEDEKYIVEGYATTFDKEYKLYSFGDYDVYEVVDKKAFDECDMSDVIFQYDHQGRVFARLSNGTLKLETDDNGLKVIADLGGTEIGRQLHEEIKGGYTSKMSFGFIVGEDKVLEEKIDERIKITRTITKISKLFDVSAVSLPANDTTSISARNFANGVISAIEAEKTSRANTIAKLKLKLALMED